MSQLTRCRHRDRVPARAKGPHQAGQQGNPKTEAANVELPGLGRASRKEMEMATAINVNLNLSE